MRLRDSVSTYGAVSRTHHWLGAVLVLAMLGIGLYFPDLPPGAPRTYWRTLHIAIGTGLLPLVAFRLGWRLTTRAPARPALAHAMHRLMMATLVAMLASGVLMQWFDGRPIGLFDLLRIASPLTPSALWHERMALLHGVLAWSLVGLIVVHLLGMLKDRLAGGGAAWSRMAGHCPRQ